MRKVLSSFVVAAVIVLVAHALNTARNERPAGLPNGVTQFFTLKHKPLSKWAVSLFVNGVHQEPGFDYDVIPNTNQIGFYACCLPKPGDRLLADYDY